MKNAFNNFWFWILALFFLISVFTVSDGFNQKAQIPYSEFIAEVEAGHIEKVEIKSKEITGTFKEGYGKQSSSGLTKEFTSYRIQDDDSLVPTLRKSGVEFESKPGSDESILVAILVNSFPILLLIAVWIFFMKQIQIGGGKAMSFGKSKAREVEESEKTVTFKDLAGIDEAQSEVEIIVSFLKNPKKFTKLGGKIPRGVLLVGNPGTGKTLLARAIAGEAGVPFYTISGSDFVEMFVGVGASRVRDMFAKAKKNNPCIVFIDEIDAVGRHRGAGLGGGHDEREQTLNQLLVEMDGFDTNDGVILIAATNRLDVLDPALLRPGRFDRRIHVSLPDINGREAILRVHASKIVLDPEVDLNIVAKGTPGFSGADLANLVNEAALHAAFLDEESVRNEHFDFAKDKILMGSEKRSLAVSEKEKQSTAFHEAGHALVAKLLPNADPVHKVTIIPRGRAMGLMQQLPDGDKWSYAKEYWLDQLCVLFGGRVAENKFSGDLTTGASSDIQRATEITRKMVCEWGMSEEIGAVNYSDNHDNPFVGMEYGHKSKEYSEETAAKIDKEIKRILDQQLDRAKNIIEKNWGSLEKIANLLLEKETINAADIDSILAS